jgi:hypothetical protein
MQAVDSFMTLMKGQTLLNDAAAPDPAVPVEAIPTQAVPVDATAADGVAPAIRSLRRNNDNEVQGTDRQATQASQVSRIGLWPPARQAAASSQPIQFGALSAERAAAAGTS